MQHKPWLRITCYGECLCEYNLLADGISGIYTNQVAILHNIHVYYDIRNNL